MAVTIGVDLDNTLACVDLLYAEVAEALGLGKFRGMNKQEVKGALVSQDGDETLWQKVQGQVFGPWYQKASVFPGASEVIEGWLKLGHKVLIISHKTRRGHFDESQTDLHEAARQWLKDRALVGHGMLSAEDVIFRTSRDEKVKAIRQKDCEIFIDDLMEVLSHEQFPETCRPVLFCPLGDSGTNNLTVATSWSAVEKRVFDMLEKA